MRSGDWARRRRLGVYSPQHLARRPGEGASPDSMHQLLPARRGARGGSRGSAARSSRPMARSVNKSGPHAGPQLGDERSGAAQQHPSGRACKRARRDGDPARGPDAQPPGSRARTSHCLRSRRRPLYKCPLPGLRRVHGPVCQPPGSPPRESGPERDTDSQGDRPVSVAENPGLEVPKSGTETHTERHTQAHARPPRS